MHNARSPESLKVNNVEGRNMVGKVLKMGLPEALLPEAETIHLLAAVAERGVGQGCSVEIHIIQLLQISTHNLHRKKRVRPRSKSEARLLL